MPAVEKRRGVALPVHLPRPPVLVVSCDELNDAGQPIVVDVTTVSPQGPASLLTVHVGNDLGRVRPVPHERCCALPLRPV